MTTTTRKTVLLNAISIFADTFLDEISYSDQKEQQLRDLGFTKSEYIEDAEDYRQFHELAIAYNEKYPNYIYLTYRQFKSMLKQYELFKYEVSECKTSIPDSVLDELLSIEIEMGIIDQQAKRLTDSDFGTWYDEMNKLTSEMYNDIILGSRGYGKSVFQSGWMDSPDFKAVRPITRPMPLVRLSVDTLKPALYPVLTTGTDTISDKKKKHLETLPLTLAEIRKDYPSALIYLRDNVADKPGETTNHLIALKVEGGYFILTHWES